MSEIKIKDSAHAVKVLEAIIEQGEERIVPFSKDVILSHTIVYINLLVEGAKAVLGAYKSTKEMDLIDAIQSHCEIEADKFVIALAQAYAPRMKEIGMEVPSA